VVALLLRVMRGIEKADLSGGGHGRGVEVNLIGGKTGVGEVGLVIADIELGWARMMASCWMKWFVSGKA